MIICTRLRLSNILNILFFEDSAVIPTQIRKINIVAAYNGIFKILFLGISTGSFNSAIHSIVRPGRVDDWKIIS
jgi:hypothetical protein